MGRTQLNTNINPDLLNKLKKMAMMSGKTLSSFVCESLANQIENVALEDIDPKVQLIEERLEYLESMVSSLLPENQKINSYTIDEAKNCNEFFKAIFKEEMIRKQYESPKDAWNELIANISCFDQWNDTFTLRLKEILFIDHGDPLTSDELNMLTNGKTCPCPIRSGLINWINNSEEGTCACEDQRFPSIRTICQKGSKSVEEIYSNS